MAVGPSRLNSRLRVALSPPSPPPQRRPPTCNTPTLLLDTRTRLRRTHPPWTRYRRHLLNAPTHCSRPTRRHDGHSSHLLIQRCPPRTSHSIYLRCIASRTCWRPRRRWLRRRPCVPHRLRTAHRGRCSPCPTRPQLRLLSVQASSCSPFPPCDYLAPPSSSFPFSSSPSCRSFHWPTL